MTRSTATTPGPAAGIARAARAWLDAWILRRGPARPPLALRYRQIFILPTPFGWMLGLLMFAMLMGSLNFNNNLGLLTTFIVAGIALMSMFAAYRNLEGVSILRTRAEPVFAGQPLKLAVHLANPAGRERAGLVVDSGRGAGASDIDAGATAVVRLEIPGTTRGLFDPGRLRIQTRHPLGLFEAWSWFWPEQAFVVWPRPAPQPPPLPASAAPVSGSMPGDESDEFHGLRAWREGDPLHRIAWKASQRHQKLLARQFSRHRPGPLSFSLENTPGRDLEERLSVITAWIIEAERRELPYALRLPGLDTGHGCGEHHRVACLDALARCG